MSGNSLNDEILLDEYCLKICEKLSTRQIASIIGELEDKSCHNCNNDNCQANHGFDAQASETEIQKDYCCPMWFNPVLVGKSKLLKR